MSKKSIFSVLSIILILIIGYFGLPYLVLYTQVARETLPKKIVFENNTTIEQALKTLEQEKPDFSIIESEFKVGEEKITDFVIQDQTQKAEEIKDEYRQNRKQFLEKNLKIESNGKTEDIKSTLNPAEIQKSLKTNQTEEIIVKSITLGDINSTQGSSPSSSSSTQNIEKSWMPNKGETYFGEGDLIGSQTSNNRFNYNVFQWDKPDFQNNSTYEQDIFLLNDPSTQNKTYLSKETTTYPGCFPILNYASTNLPNAYLDTRFTLKPFTCDNSEVEISYTIGTSKSSSIQAGSYFTYLSTNKGENDTPIFKLQFQLGDRWPEWCYSTWCSWAKETKIVHEYGQNTTKEGDLWVFRY